MRRVLQLVAALALASAAPAQSPTISTMTSPITLQLDGIPTSALVTMLMRDVMRVPYVIAPDVLSDRRPVSVKLVIPRDKVPERVVGYLRKSGFVVTLQDGTVFVSRGNKQSFGGSSAGYATPFGSPLSPGEPRPISDYRGALDVSTSPVVDTPGRFAPVLDPVPAAPAVVVAYAPAHRDTDYIGQLVAAMFPDLRLGSRSGPKADAPEGNIDPRDAPDLLVMAGSADDIARARKLVAVVDRPRPLVSVKAVVMQVQDVQARGSALSVFADIAGGRISGGSFAAEAPGSQFLRISTGLLKATLSAVREDSRFKVVATPNLSALSGGVASMNAGAQVPTVGAVTVAEGGTPVQSVVYRDSGITLAVRPVVRGEFVQLDVKEERSTFVRTTTGVEDSPTLQKSSVDAQVMLKSGESVVLAGLTEESAGNRREGLLGGLLGVRSRDKSQSELLVILTAEIVPVAVGVAGTFFEIEGDDDGDPDPLAPDAPGRTRVPANAA